MKFTLSARSKPARVPIQMLIKQYYSHIPLEQIESFFGFAEVNTLYGGRFFTSTELSQYDLRSMYKMNINYRIPLSNHYVTAQEYSDNLPFLEKQRVNAVGDCT